MMIQDGSTCASGLEGDTEKEVVILLCDMVRYTQITEDMRPNEIRDFIVEYHRNLRKIIQAEENGLQEIEPSAGDGAIAIFEKKEDECGKSGMCIRALKAAINIASNLWSIIPKPVLKTKFFREKFSNVPETISQQRHTYSNRRMKIHYKYLYTINIATPNKNIA